MKMTNYTPWRQTSQGKTDYVSVSVDAETVSAVFTSGKYGCAVFQRELTEVNSCCYYKISADIKSDKQTVKLIVGFKNNEGIELTKAYVKNGEEVLSPENAVSAVITVSVWSNNGGEFSLCNLSFEETGKYVQRKVTVASVGLKYNRVVRTPEWNMQQTVSEIDRLCSENKTDLIVLTEHMYDRWTNFSEPITMDSDTVKKLCQKALEYSTYIVCSLRIKDGEKLVNRGFLINRKGEIEGTYDKTHITMGERLNGFEPGNDFTVFDTELGKIAIVICWDMFFPEYISELRKKKVDIICHPSAGYLERRIAERAYECGAYIVTSGVEELSHSAVFNPLGEIIADASENDGYAVCDIDLNKPYYTYWLSYPAHTSSGNIFENERRGDLYSNEKFL